MAYSLYWKDRWLGHLANISGYGLIVSAVNRYNGAAGNRGKIPALTDFIEKGETKDVQALIRDVSRLLTWKRGLSKITVMLLKHFRRLLRNADGPVIVSD